MKTLRVLATGLFGALLSLLVLAGRADAATYNFPLGQTISLTVLGDITSLTTVRYDLSFHSVIFGTCPENGSCFSLIGGEVTITNSLSAGSHILAKLVSQTFNGVTCSLGVQCDTEYFPGSFTVSDTVRDLTINSDGFLVVNTYQIPTPDVFITFDLPDGLTLAQSPLPPALPLFATGLGALGLLGWRRKRKKYCS